MATSEENARIASEYFTPAMNDNVVDESVLSDDYVVHMESHGTSTTEDVRAGMARIAAGIPDRTVEVEAVVAADDDVVIRWRLTGTHTRAFMGLEPTGNAVDIVGLIQSKIEEGTIVEAWNLSDRFTLMQQLGLIDPPGA